jgi:predicted kinase
MATLIVLIGQSGSGKSYLSQKLTSYDSDYIQVSSDNIRKEVLGDINNQEAGGVVFDILGQRIRKNLRAGKKVIWDSTNLSWGRTKKGAFSYSANIKDVSIIFVFMMDSLDNELCKSRVLKDIANNKDRSAVPEDVIDKQHQRFLICKENALKDSEDLNIVLYDDFTNLIEAIDG